MSLTVSVFNENVKCDRYHLLKPNSTITSIPVYVENGVSFNGFNNPIILNVDFTTIYNSRMIKIQSPDILNNRRIYCLITQIVPITKNKCYVYYELDAWLTYSYKNDDIIGLNNYLFETTNVIDYPYYDLNAKSKVINLSEKIENTTAYNVLMLYHDSSLNFDKVYYFAFYKMYGFGFYSTKLFDALQTLNIDTNNIVGFYLSPFDVRSYFTNMVYEDTPMTFQVFDNDYDSFIRTSINAPKYHTVTIYDNYLYKTVITDMTGSIVWTSIREDDGNRLLVYRIDLRYDGCFWDCSIINGDTVVIQDSPNKRFAISCVDMGFFVDYYQQYQNIQKSANSELRKAQLEKQLIDNIGGIVSSTTSGIIGGAIAGSGLLGGVGGAVGGITKMATSYYSTSDYNRKLETIEEKQAIIQYDSYLSGSNTFFTFLTGESEPCLNLMTIDDPSLNSGLYDGSTPYLKYNCRIRQSDLIDLIFDNTPLYLSGDFDFINMNVEMSNQLNERFKHGVYFTDWE